MSGGNALGAPATRLPALAPRVSPPLRARPAGHRSRRSTLPYWDWTVDNPTTSSIWDADFHGWQRHRERPQVARPARSRSRPGTGRSPCSIRMIRPTTPIPAAEGSPQASLGAGAADSDQQVTNCLTETPYDESPWDDSSLARSHSATGSRAGSARARSTTACTAGSAGTSARCSTPPRPTTRCSGCTTATSTGCGRSGSEEHPAEAYHPSGVGADTGPAGHNLPDSMQPWGGATTVAATLEPPLRWATGTTPIRSTSSLTTPSLTFADVPQGSAARATPPTERSSSRCARASR